MQDSFDDIANFKAVLAEHGLPGALEFLNRRAPHRFTAVYKIDGVETEAMQWRSATELDDLRQMDIGLMPLPDENWSRGKCGLKALQYMALGIPTICSPVGVNSTIINDGENGFLADGKDEWIAKLKRLIHSAELRRKIGLAGRETVEKEYSAKVVAPRVLEVFRSAASVTRV